MKKTLLILMMASMLALTARGQVLQNTLWRQYLLPNVAQTYWQYGQDTLSWSIDNIVFNAREVFTTSSNVYNVIDIIGCTGADTGRYTFSIQLDTLRFHLISDICVSRPDEYSFTLVYFVRLYTGIEDINPISTVTISPNPSADGIFNLSFNGNGNLPKRIYVMSADGRKIMDETFSTAATNHSISLQSCASGIYFLVMENEKGRRVEKLVR